MDLRNDPKASALMAIELSRANLNFLQQELGTKIGKTELYIAHFLGRNDAVRFIRAFHADGKQSAAALFPGPAQRNPNVFYNGKKHPNSLEAIYTYFKKRMSGNDLVMTAPLANGSLHLNPSLK